MFRAKMFRGVAWVLTLTTLSLVGVAPAHASRKGRRNTTLLLGAVAAYGLLKGKTELGVLGAVGTYLAYQKYRKSSRSRDRYRPRYGTRYQTSDYSRYDSGYGNYSSPIRYDTGYSAYRSPVRYDNGYAARYDDGYVGRYNRGSRTAYRSYGATRCRDRSSYRSRRAGYSPGGYYQGVYRQGGYPQSSYGRRYDGGSCVAEGSQGRRYRRDRSVYRSRETRYYPSAYRQDGGYGEGRRCEDQEE